jgi:hypothetical protein
VPVCARRGAFALRQSGPAPLARAWPSSRDSSSTMLPEGSELLRRGYAALDATLIRDAPEVVRTGVTAIWPRARIPGRCRRSLARSPLMAPAR